MRALGRKSGGDDAGEAVAAQEAGMPDDLAIAEEMLLEEAWAETEPAAPTPARFAWLVPALALAAIAGWTGFFGWTASAEVLARPAPAFWAQWIVQWSVPVGLIGIFWLLAMRSSRAEANRFAATAALLSRESAELEERLKVVNRELSLAREFLAAEARDLEALGRIAAERIANHAGELQQLITANGAQVEAISTASETALGNMNRLRDDLPVIANAARDVANQIGSAGNHAQGQLDRLTEGFAQLDQLGASSDARVQALSATIAQSLDSFEAQVARVEALVANRFVGLQGEAAAWRERLEEAEARTLAALRERIAAITEEADQIEARLTERDLRFAEAIEQRQAAFDTREAQASEVLSQRLATLDDALAQRREAQIADAERLVAQGEALAVQLDKFGALLGEISQQGESASSSLSRGFDTLGEKLAANRVALAETEARLGQLTESGIRLLEIIQSGARTSREDLQQAIATAGDSLAAVEKRANEVRGLMLDSSRSGSDLSDYLIKTRSAIDAADEALGGLRARLAEQADEALARLQGLRGGFARLAQESGTLAGETQDQLRSALAALEAAIAQAFVTLEEGTREKAAGLATSLGNEAVAVLEKALRNEAAATIGKIEQAAAHASGVGREVVVQLRDQLARVNELTGNLEQRVARARELAEEQVNNDFARRMALIVDSLNSAAIDISGALSTEVADTAWDAYLKGDRGIFTRRAVRLIDNGAARDISELYSRDETFKANVNRYIHDFEAMLRATLSTRDGHVLSVTMLGSDMGKLYVVLAQAIQRLRT
jgi:molecular chaperone GrpE (heat shock protein)